MLIPYAYPQGSQFKGIGAGRTESDVVSLFALSLVPQAVSGCRNRKRRNVRTWCTWQGDTMEVAIRLPDTLVKRLQEQWGDLSRRVLESVALLGYRERILTTEEIRQLLGFETRSEVHAFLKQHKVPF
jgi:hypothetical protein